MELEPWGYWPSGCWAIGPVSDASALKQTPNDLREMAKDLELHLGAVSRDVSNMQDAGASQHRVLQRARRYIVNEQSLSKFLARHILDALPVSRGTDRKWTCYRFSFCNRPIPQGDSLRNDGHRARYSLPSDAKGACCKR